MTYLDEDLNAVAKDLKELFSERNTFFITGSTGLVGTLLVKSILYCNKKYNTNNYVVAFARNRIKAEEIFADYIGNPNLFICTGDVNQEFQYDGNVDYLIHAASETKSINMVKKPIETLWTSINGTKNALDFACVKNVKGMVYLSSMEAFGRTNPVLKSVKEDDLGYIDITNVRSCYPESKRLNENMCACYAQEKGLKVCSARLAQTFGAGISKSENRIFAQFAKSVLEESNIVLHTKGDSYGNYVYSSDAARAIFRLLEKGNMGEVYTIANEDSCIKIRDMAQLVAEKLANNKIKVIYDIPENNKYGYAPDVVMHLDSSKMQQLGWKPEISLLDSYKRLIASWGEI